MRNVFKASGEKTMKKAAFLLFIIITLAFCIQDLNAAWWDFQRFPVPVGARELKRSTRDVGGSKFDFTYYTSSQSRETIMEFYRGHLPQSGWKEQDLKKKLSDAAGEDIGPSMENFLGHNLVFRKGKRMIVINFLPEGIAGEGVTRFTFSEGERDYAKNMDMKDKSVPKLSRKPKIDIAPEYPGASVVTFLEKEKYLLAVYHTKDNVGKVSEFYKANMPRYGWSFDKEIAPEKVNPKDVVSRLNYSNDVNKNVMMPLPQHLEEVVFTELSFTNEKGDACKVGITENKFSYGSNITPQFTNIRVAYDGKKK